MVDKEFKSYNEQIDILKSRNLIVDDSAIEILKYENYYEIINGYKDLFIKTKSPETYIELVSKEIDSLASKLGIINITKVLGKIGYPSCWKNIIRLSNKSLNNNNKTY